MAQTAFTVNYFHRHKHIVSFILIAILIISATFSAALTALAAGTLTVQVYIDDARDGFYDTDSGVSGVLVSVYSSDGVIVGLNTTNSAGEVVFPSLPDGNYRIEVSNLGARVVSIPGLDNAGLLSFATISGGAVTQRVGLRDAVGGIDTAAPPGTRNITARVWDDRDADGIQDAGEPGLGSLPVILVDSLGNTIAGPVNTDSQGRAIFSNAPTGAGYRLRILSSNFPTGYILTQAFVNDGSPNPGIRDSDAVLVGVNAEATLPNTGRGANIDNIDIGFARGAVSGFVWRDNNRNGQWEATEPRINGITVQLTSGPTVVATTTSRQLIGSSAAEDGGIFVFPGVPLGPTYRVVIPASQFASGAILFGAANSINVAGGDVGSPNGIPTSDVTGPNFPINTTTNTRSDQRFGFYKGLVGDFVWLDDDNDGVQDPGENGVNGVIVFVDDGRGSGTANNGIRDGNELMTVTTNNPNTNQPGYYQFDDLPLGASYRIVLDEANFLPGGALVGLGNSTGTVATNGNGNDYIYFDSGSLSAADPEDDDVDFGLTRARIGNLVFEDVNGDGIYNTGDNPLSGVEVNAYRASDDVLLGSATSNGSGIYAIPGLPAEEIYVTFEAPLGFVGSLRPSGATLDPEETSFADYSDLVEEIGTSGVWRTDIFTPVPGQTYDGIDAGFYRPVRIVVTTFADTITINNIRESGEPGIGNVTVAVTGTVSRTATTNPTSGDVVFLLPPGSYTVTVTTPAGYLQSPGNTGSQSFASLISGQTIDAPFGYYRPGRISGVVFFDTNGDSLASSEPRMRDVTVELLDSSSTVVSTTTTLTNGTYSFTNIFPGNYTVRFTNPATGNYTFITGGDSVVTTAGPVATSSTALLTVPYNGSLTDINAGFRGQTTVSGRVFEDNNADNLQDFDDVDLSGATVALTVTASLPNLVATYQATISASPPNYLFNNLPGGSAGTITYTIAFTPPAGGYIASDANVGSDDTIDSDGPTVTVTGPTPGGTLDFDQGFFRNVTITARVFREPSAGRNNQWESGENGISGARVVLERLDNTPVLTETTNSNGLVTFAVRPGSYQLNVDESSAALAGLLPSSGSTAAIPVAGIPLASGGSSLTQISPPGTTNVFGFYVFGVVDGRVFFDGANGPADNQSAGEPGVSNVTVRLLNASTTAVVATTTTNASGNFSFNSVEGGSYLLEFVNPDAANFSFVAGPAGNNDVASIVSNNGRTAAFTVTDGQITTRGAAVIGNSAINGIAFVDRAYDGQRTSDPGLAGVTVNLSATINLTNLTTTVNRTVTTNSNGEYSFSGLPGGASASEAAFTLTFSPPTATPAYQLTLADQGADATDSDGVAELTNQPLAVGATVSRDQGYYQNVTVSARVFNETVTINNAFETGESGLRAVTVNVTGPISTSQATNIFGIVTFNGPPGAYTFTVPTDPSGFIRSPGNTGAASTGLVLSGATPDPVPFGYYRPAQITGTIWFDTDSDGALDSGEPGMESVSVRLVGSSSGPGTPVTTDGNGAFTISGIEPTGLTNASYQLCVTLPGGFTFTTPGSALTTDNNSDVTNSTTGCTDAFTVSSGDDITYIDAGLRGALSIGDLIWEDANGNGVQDSGEQALDGVTVTVVVSTTGSVINATNPSFTFSAVSTSASGLSANYSIGNIPPGSTVTIQSVSRFGYLLTVANQGGNPALDSNAVGSSVTLTTSNTTIDFGLYRTTAIGDTVWFDANGNGLRDAGEPGIAGISVTLRGSGGNPITTTQTLADGSYAFSDVAPGTYSLQITLPAGYTTSNNGSGSLTVDNDNDFRTDGTTTNFTILSGQALDQIDAGLRGAGSISGIAWFDTNENNQRDLDETGRLAGVQVTVTYTPTLLTGFSQTVQAQTAGDGSYSVTGLPPGQVTLTFVNQLGYILAQPNVGDDATDSDGPVVTLTLAPGQQAVFDIGYYRRVAIFLPMTIVQIPPDLIVSLQATPTSPNKNTPVTYRVTITNVGREPASNFWIDLYVNPRRVPEVNEPWNELSRQGLAWFFDGVLQPGESVTLISTPRSPTNPFGYDVTASSPTWNGRLPPGRNTIYVYVDSWNRSIAGDVRSPFGAVEEVNETNNRAEITIVVSE